jgi:hypothetical protein
VAPVLDHHVDLAVAHALPGDLLLDVLVLDLAAELALGDVADHVRGRLVADPGVDRHVELAAVRGLACAAAGRRGVLDVAAATGGQGQAQHRHERGASDSSQFHRGSS